MLHLAWQVLWSLMLSNTLCPCGTAVPEWGCLIWKLFWSCWLIHQGRNRGWVHPRLSVHRNPDSEGHRCPQYNGKQCSWIIWNIGDQSVLYTTDTYQQRFKMFDSLWTRESTFGNFVWAFVDWNFQEALECHQQCVVLLSTARGVRQAGRWMH